MAHLLLRGSLLAFLLFPAFLTTGLASAPVSEPCPSHPNLEPGDPLDEMVVESIEICGTFAGDPKPLKKLIGLKNRDQARRQVCPWRSEEGFSGGVVTRSD